MHERVASRMRYALRQLRKSPGLAAVASVTLALGMGAKSALAVLLRPLPFADSNRLIWLNE
jgi:hypothetical protein